MKNSGLVVLLMAALALSSCGGGGGSNGGDGDDTEPVSVDIGESAVTIEVGGTVQFHYSVSHSSDTTVTWKVNDVTGGNATVGTISTSGLYTAPAAVPDPNQVTIKAVANADTSKFDTATVTITPATSLTISPTSVTVTGGATQQFTSSSGATWEVIGPAGTDASTWGTINASGLYTAPSAPPWLGKVTVKATSTTDTSLTATATVTVTFSNASLSGRYAFRYRTVEKPSGGFTGRLWAIGSFEADGQGGITNGSADFISFASTGNGALNASFTGTYSIGADGRATAEFILGITGSPVLPMRWVVNSPLQARITGFDDTGSGWGNIDRQDLSSFGTGLDGTYVFMGDGLMSPQLAVSAAGMFDASGTTISSGVIDINENGSLTSGAAFAGTCSAIDPATGRGTWQITADGEDYSFVFYAMNAYQFIWGSTAADQGYLGIGVKQDKSAPYANSSLQGNTVFFSTGYVPVNQNEAVPSAAAGVLSFDGQGNITSGTVDSIVGGSGAVNAPASGTYAVSSNGHGTLSLVVAGGTNTVSLYLYAANQGFYVSMMPSVSSTAQILPQSSGPYDAASFRSSWALTARGTFVDASNDFVAQMTLDGVSALAGMADANYAGVLSPGTGLAGSYSMAANGRGEFTLTLGQASCTYAFYAYSKRAAFLVPISSGATTQIGYAYRQY